jgi:hypothetical protein
MSYVGGGWYFVIAALKRRNGVKNMLCVFDSSKFYLQFLQLLVDSKGPRHTRHLAHNIAIKNDNFEPHVQWPTKVSSNIPVYTPWFIIC